MSVNTLLDNPSSNSKAWCKLYVQDLHAYGGITQGLQPVIKDELTPMFVNYQDSDISVSFPTANAKTSISKLGKQVTLWINDIDPTTTPNDGFAGIITFNGLIPEGYRPTASGDLDGPFFWEVNNVEQFGKVTVKTNGDVTLLPFNSTNIAANIAVSWSDITFTYLID